MKNLWRTQKVNATRILLIILLLTSVTVIGYSQAGISPSASIPNASAGLDINFPASGLLIPRIALTGTTSPLPLTAHVAGMVVYNTATAADVSPGLYFSNGTIWVPCPPVAYTAGEMQYWNGARWLAIPIGAPGQMLQINSNGVPAWTGAGYANVATTPVNTITSTSAASGGNISSDGGTAVTARGVCWSTSPNPTIAGSKTVDGTGTGIFTSTITGLITGTIYYVRTYATNSTGTSYGNQLIFTTL